MTRAKKILFAGIIKWENPIRFWFFLSDIFEALDEKRTVDKEIHPFRKRMTIIGVIGWKNRQLWNQSPPINIRYAMNPEIVIKRTLSVCLERLSMNIKQIMNIIRVPVTSLLKLRTYSTPFRNCNWTAQKPWKHFSESM